jgi:hypothetical protein
MTVIHRGPHDLEMKREEHGHTGESDQGWPGKKIIDMSGMVAMKVTVVGSVTYIGKAVIGSSQSDAVWQAQKIDATTGTIITWADGGKFTQVATDLTSLSYL